jgi:hypothetical protein
MISTRVWTNCPTFLPGSIDVIRRHRPDREANVFVPEPYTSWCRPDLLQHAIGCPDGKAR